MLCPLDHNHCDRGEIRPQRPEFKRFGAGPRKSPTQTRDSIKARTKIQPLKEAATRANFKVWKQAWQELGDSNPRPSVLETDALPTELNS